MTSRLNKIAYTGDKDTYLKFVFVNALISAIEGRYVTAKEVLDEMIRDYYKKICQKYGIGEEEARTLVRMWLSKQSQRKYANFRKVNLEELKIA